MKNRMPLMVAMAAAAVFAGCCDKCSCKTAKPKRAKVTVEPGKVLAETDFAKGLGNWKASNFQNILTFVTTNRGDGAELVIRNDRIGDKKARDTLFKLTSELFAVEPAAEIAVVTEARGDVSMLGPVIKNGVATGILWYGADRKPLLIQDALGKMVPSAYEFNFPSVGAGWVRTVNRTTVPDGAAFAAVQVGGDGPDIAPGMALELKRITVRARVPGASWDFGDLEPPTFKLLTESPNPDRDAVIRFKVEDESELDPAKFSCTIDGEDVKAKLVREGDGVFSFRPDKPWENDSLHLVALDATDDCGNRGTETLAFFCGRRIEKGLVTLRDDGMTLVDGKPFFPIAPFSFRKCPPNGYDLDKGLKELKAGGVNTVHSYLMYQFGAEQKKPHHREYLDLVRACERNGMKLIVEAGGRDYKNPKRPEFLREVLLHGRDYSCILAWGIGDDTASHRRADELKDDDNICKAIDNARLTTQADITTYAGRYKSFVNSTDTIMTEIYPYRAAEAEPQGLSDVVRDMKYAFADKKAAGDPVKGIWPLVQAFSGWSLWKRFPTRDEIRAQSYLGIIHGGRAITYYTYWSFSKGANGAAHSPEQLKTLLSVTKELASIQDDLASRDAKDQPKVSFVNGPEKNLGGNASVSCLLKEGADGKGKLLLAANSVTDKSVKVKFVGVKGRVETLFENGRTVDASNGLVDTFAPGEVHVYRLK